MSISKMNSHWAKWAGPYYSDWIDPSRGEKMGIWFPAAGWKFFYVDEDRRPINPKDPNDPNYDWGFVERALASDAVKRDGATVNIRLDLEGKGMFPDWYKAAGYTTIPAGKHKSIVNWGNPHAVQELKDFITAFAKRYNDNKHLYTIAISEQGGSSKTKNAATIKVGVIKHIAKNFDHMMLSVFQNVGTWKDLKGIPGIGRGIADAKPFFGSCGSSGRNYGDGGKPLCDCNAGGMWGLSQHNTSVTDVPSCSGIDTFSVVSGEPNGFKVVGDSGSTPNPFGRQLPFSGEQLPESDLTPAVYAWYHGYKPRGNKKSSGLGFLGTTDPAGINPSHVIILSGKTQGAKPADWDRAFSTFGKAGTNAILWPPANFSPSSKPNPKPIPRPEPEPLPEPEPEPLPEPEPESKADFGTPDNFSATPLRRRAKLSWDDVEGERLYRIKWRKGSKGKWKVIRVDANKTSFVHKGLKSRSTYEYRIRADRSSRKGGNSNWSSINSVTIR
ncbi:MAG: fibronectin type III domain-containing protein [Gammaproteobacteria bacterium]|nr:fibronectin type III domain-containing protein [Gammaproteobacteria bacterium]